MSDFVGRTAELQRLDQLYAGRESAFVPIYGRRRIGKSELIVRFLHGKPGIYFLGKQATPGATAPRVPHRGRRSAR